MLKIIRESVRHEDGLFAQRANFFLLSQAIFFAAFSQTTNENKPLQGILFGLGLLTVLIWIIVSIRNVKLIKRLRKMEKEELRKSGEKALPQIGWNFLGSNNLIGIVFPVSFLVSWIVIAFNYII